MLWYIVTRGENMDENLITKKELLELTGISYGALYRWKRMKLLPDDWFIYTHGKRRIENKRYLLDFRNPEVRRYCMGLMPISRLNWAEKYCTLE